MQLNVDQRSPQIEVLCREWEMLECLWGGTDAMREAGHKFLPKWPAEDEKAYDHRLHTATLLPAFRRTVRVMAGKPFSKQLTLSDDTPALIKQWCDDVDREGVSLHNFSAHWMEQTLAFGMAGILVDYPPVPPGATLADERNAGGRPYFVGYSHRQILGWQQEIINGVTRLTQLRLKEITHIPDGLYGTKHVDRVRVLYPGGWQLFESDDTAYQLIDEGVTRLDRIPFVPLYGSRIAYMLGQSPLLDLAYLNVKHWQSQSDQDTILHVARVPILALIGADDQSQITVGGSSAIKLPDGADAKFVEHSGAAIGAGAKALDSLVEQMRQAGAELIVENQGGARTATEDSNDQEANKSDLQRIVEGFEDSLDQALEFMAEYGGLDSSGSVSLYKDFNLASLSDIQSQLVVTMEQGGLISKVTAIKELQRRGVLSPEVDPVAEAEAVEAQGPALGAMGGVQEDGLDNQH